MENSKIPFNYFYQMFKEQFQKKIVEMIQSGIAERDSTDLEDILYFYLTASLEKESRLSIYDKIIFEICANYVELSDAPIDVYPLDPFEFVDLILEKIQENPYKKSFLLSLQFIYQDYFEYMEKGRPILMASKEESTLSSFQITIDSNYKIVEFDNVNMDLIEQDRIMNTLLIMEKNKQIGPIPKVLMRIRKDI